MKYDIKFCLILFIFIIVSIGAVSATEDNSMNFRDNGVSDNSINPISNTEHVITESNYNTYFDEDGNMLSSIGGGDTLKLSGKFEDKKFVFNKNVTIIGDNVEIKQGTVVLIKGASGSTISNLKIINDGNNLQGIFLSEVTNCLIDNNNITCAGRSSFAIALNPDANYNTISNNFLKTGGINGYGTQSTSVLVLGGANYNTISNNILEVDDANGIYLSKYGSGSFLGGQSDYNVIFNNTIKCMVVPTSWCYGIQLMGSHNKADSNTVIGTYRGISGEDYTTVINNKLINLTGKDFSTGKLIGGDNGIIVGANSNVSNNILSNCLIEQSGISIADNGIVKDNIVDNIGIGYGIGVNGNNVKVINNNVTTTTGACVYQAGKLKGLLVKDNILTSNSGVGVLAVKTSSSKYPTNITITNNKITTSNQYAINAKDANKSSYLIKDNKIAGTSKILTPDGEVAPEPEFNFNGTIYDVNPDNYHAFFDNNGNIVNVLIKDGDILNFTGVFEDKYPIISYSLKLIGSNATFINSEIKPTSDSVWIENLTIRNTNASLINTWGIFAESINNIMIVNNDIFVYDKNAAYAIYLNGVSKATIKDNNLSSSGDYLTYPVLLYGVENSVVENNKIIANGTGQVHGYEPTKCLDGEKCLDGNHMVAEIFRTYGILLITSSENSIISNDVTVTSKLNQSQPKVNGSLSTNSIVGIDAYHDSNDNIFDGNTVLVYGNDNYIYGMGVLGAETGSGKSQYSQNNVFSNNDITVKGENMGTGLISGYHAENNVFINNTVDILANNSAYGITLEYGKNSNVSGNNFSLKSDISYGIEMFEGDNNIISENSIKTEGSYAFGIGGYHSVNNTIIDNQINVNSTGNKSIVLVNHTDALGFGNSGVIFKVQSTGNVIEDNIIITTKGQAVNLTDVSNNKVIHNYLKGETAAGDDAVDGTSNNIVENNYGYEFTNVSLNNATSIYLGNATLVANSGIVGDNKTNVKFYVNGNYVGNATTVNGKASLNVNLSNTVGNYELIAEFIRNGYNSINTTAKLTILKGNINVIVLNTSGKKGTGFLLKAIIKDEFGNPVENMEVIFNRGSNYVGKATSNNLGVAEVVWNCPAGITSSSDVLNVKASGNNLYNPGNGTGTISYTNITQTIIKVDNLIKYCHNDSKLKGTLSDLNNNPLPGVVVSININGKIYNKTTDNKGEFSMGIYLGAGNYSVITSFAGNSSYYGTNTSSNIEILPIIYGNNTVLYFANGTEYKALFVDGSGNPLKNAKVQLNINGKIYDRVTDENGIAKLGIYLKPGEYVITAIGTTGAMHSNNITVLSTIISSDLTKYYANDSKYVVKVLDGHGNALANQKVSLNINGKIYERITDENGTASLGIYLSPGNSEPKEYIITAMCNGLYVSSSITVLPVLSGEPLTEPEFAGANYTVKLVDGQGNAIVNKTVEININGVIYKRITDAEGNARLAIYLKAGEYIATAMYPPINAMVSNKIIVTSRD